MKSTVSIVLIFCCLFSFQQILAFHKLNFPSDSLVNYSKVELESFYFKNLKNEKKVSYIFAKELLSRAKKAKDSFQIAKSYNYIIRSSDKKALPAYADSLIRVSKGKDYGYYPGIGHYIEAIELYKSKKFIKTLDKLLIADSLLSQVDTVKTKYWIKQAMGLFKSMTGDYEGALNEYRINFKYYEQTEDWDSYNYNVFAAIESFLKLQKVDSADYYCKIALEKSNDSKKLITPYLRMSSGIIDYYKGNYGNSIEALLISEKKMDSLRDYDNLAHCYHYLGLANYRLNNKNTALNHLKKVDSIFQKHDYVNVALRESYLILIEDSRKQDNVKNELYYLNNLISLDSTASSYNSYLKDNIISNYEIPKFLERKDKILFEYRIKQKKSLIIILGLLVLLIASITIIYIVKKREKNKETNYKKIILELKSDSGHIVLDAKNSTIPQSSIRTLSEAFIRYDLKKEYTKGNFNKEYIRKDTGINNHYIADYLRDFMGYSLTTYINNKRTELAVEKILNDSTFNKFTMQAMAEVVGFKTASTFKRAFKTRVGMSPLDFISRSSKVSNS